ncbi:MAG TPA: hypothetical protein VJB99_02240 [Patescibacteria group bacterium]|nr:hypothetical protein [Patescibacteria group bacterium]
MSDPSPKTVSIRLQKKTLLTLLGVAILYATFLLKSPSYVGIDTRFMIEVILVTLFTRTVSLRYGLGLFAQGVVLSGMATLILWRFTGLFGLHDTQTGEIIAVVAEEVFKFAPVALAAFLSVRHRKIPFNVSDFLFLSAMCAAGFSLFEKFFWQDVSFPFTYGPHLGRWFFFPDALGIYVDGKEFGYIGHAAATGLIGMGVGLGLLLKTQRKSFWWILPVFAFVWVTGEHLLSNLYYVNGTDALLAFGGGMLTPWIFLAFLVAVLWMDIRCLRRFLVANPEVREVLRKERQIFIHALREKKFDIQSGLTLLRKLRAAHSLAYVSS